jgi:hypothetical protein
MMLSWAARANSFGRSANGSAGAGVERLLQPEVVDHQPRVGFRAANWAACSRRPSTSVDRQGCRAAHQSPVDARVGGVGRNLVSQPIRIPTVPLVEAQSAIVSATAGSVVSTGDSLNRLGCAA